MKRLTGIMLAGALALSLSACGGGQTAQPPAEQKPAEQPATQQPATGGATSPSNVDAAKAEATFKNTCSSCHGQNLEGVVGPNLQKIGATLTKEQIEDVLKNGKGSMPPNLVSGDEADNLAAWLAEKK
ncbi:MAG: cytochrome c551 [Clostridia bacterium]